MSTIAALPLSVMPEGSAVPLAVAPVSVAVKVMLSRPS